MLAEEKVNDLAERKQLLLAQSQVHRLIIQLECQNLHTSLHRLNPLALGEGVEGGGRYRWLLGAAAGLLLAKRGRAVAQWVLRGLDAWRLVSRFFNR
jgi:hypothetical protein